MESGKYLSPRVGQGRVPVALAEWGFQSRRGSSSLRRPSVAEPFFRGSMSSLADSSSKAAEAAAVWIVINIISRYLSPVGAPITFFQGLDNHLFL